MDEAVRKAARVLRSGEVSLEMFAQSLDPPTRWALMRFCREIGDPLPECEKCGDHTTPDQVYLCLCHCHGPLILCEKWDCPNKAVDISTQWSAHCSEHQEWAQSNEKED